MERYQQESLFGQYKGGDHAYNKIIQDLIYMGIAVPIPVLILYARYALGHYIVYASFSLVVSVGLAFMWLALQGAVRHEVYKQMNGLGNEYGGWEGED